MTFGICFRCFLGPIIPSPGFSVHQQAKHGSALAVRLTARHPGVLHHLHHIYNDRVNRTCWATKARSAASIVLLSHNETFAERAGDTIVITSFPSSLCSSAQSRVSGPICVCPLDSVPDLVCALTTAFRWLLPAPFTCYSSDVTGSELD